MEGGPLSGISAEAVAYLVPLSELGITPLLVHGFRDASTFVSALAPEDQAVLRKLAAPALLEQRLTWARISVSQWSPGSYARSYLRLREGELGPLYRIGRAMYEGTTVPQHWHDELKTLDEIWLPSRWGQQVMQNLGYPLAQLRVVPEAIDAAHSFNPERYQRREAREEIYGRNVTEEFTVFLSVFKWESRKAPEVWVGLSRERVNPSWPP